VTSAARSIAAPRLVVLRALGLGDLCTAVPALRALRRRFPEHRLVLLTPQPLWPLVGLADVVDELADQRDLTTDLSSAACASDLAVNLHGRGPESTRLLHDSRPSRLLAFSSPGVASTGSGPGWRADEHEVDRWCRLVRTTGAVADRADVLLRPPDRVAGAGDEGPGVIVHPGAASAARRWPHARFGAVVRALLDRDHRVTITGSSAEAGLAAAVVDAAVAQGDPRCVVTAGATDLISLARLVAQADLVVAGDTGIAHLATAFARPSVLLFGPSDPAHWGPTTGGPHRVLWSGRTGDPHGSKPDPGLLEIGVADVVQAIDRSPALTTPAASFRM